MNTKLPVFAAALAAALPLWLAFATTSATAQPHLETSGDYVLRASTVSAALLPSSVRREHGIQTDPNTAVLNVTVQRASDGVLRNVPARVQVLARNLLGVETGVEMRQVVANGMVSYMGTYRFLPREVLDFRITAHPQGAQLPITLQFRDRLGRR